MDLVGPGPNTITDADELRANLATVRERGYALDREESTAGVHAIGAPVLEQDDRVVGAIGLLGPATRLKSDRLEAELPDFVLAAANELEFTSNTAETDRRPRFAHP